MYRNKQELLISPTPDTKWSILVEVDNIWYRDGDLMTFTINTQNAGYIECTIGYDENVFEEIANNED